MLTLEELTRREFTAVTLESLEWEHTPGDGQKPGYTEAIIDLEQLTALNWLAPDSTVLEISIRKYPRRYFLAVSIYPDPESEGELFIDCDDNIGLGFLPPIVSVILFKMDHAEFEEVFSELMGDVYDWISQKDLGAIHLSATLKALRP